jgi:phenylpropionate dioxygenase-like ring-hydroxylating dioxygenase large terminal subunit
MWVRNAWYVAGWRHELGAEGLLARTVIEEPLVLYRRSDGSVVALEDRCCHRLAPLSMGRREADDLRCMYHGLKFASDGRCIEIPGQPVIPPGARVRCYPAVERDSWIWVWMGDAAAADPALIPNSVALDDPAWRLRSGQLDYAADYLLIDDNLLDFSHLAFVHSATLGRNTPQWAELRPRLTRLPRGLHVERWIENQPAQSHLRRHGDAFDLWSSYDFLVPGIFLLRSAWYPAGTARRCDLLAPKEPPLFLRCDDQAVTPVTARRSRYYYLAGGRREQLDDALLDKLFAVAEAAFVEDLAIIEAQQRVLDLDPGRHMLNTSLDVGLSQFRRILRELVQRETPLAKEPADDRHARP